MIIYLPSGLGPVEPSTVCSPLATLAFASNATVVCIHYRLSAQQPYPTPVHDVLAGYDWVQQHLARRIDLDHAYPSVKAAHIGVCGELVGGSLACMLALTECRMNGGVGAAAVGNAIVDWTSLFAADNGSPASTDQGERITINAKHTAAKTVLHGRGRLLSNNTLLHLRSNFFDRAEKYFDPFASPLLFFRTPASEVPSYLSSVAAEKQSFEEDMSLPPSKKRRSHRRYPPAGSALRLPHMRIEVGAENELGHQGADLAEALRKSIRYWEESSYGACDRDALLRRIQLVKSEKIGLWAEHDMSSLGEWFGNTLR